MLATTCWSAVGEPDADGLGVAVMVGDGDAVGDGEAVGDGVGDGVPGSSTSTRTKYTGSMVRSPAANCSCRRSSALSCVSVPCTAPVTPCRPMADACTLSCSWSSTRSAVVVPTFSS